MDSIYGPVTGILRHARRGAMIFLAVMALMVLSAGQGAAKSAQGGGYTGPGPEFVTAEQAKSMADDSYVALKGHIIKRLSGDNYLFKDDSGTISLEISDKRWAGQQVGADDLVEIYGEVDKDMFDLEIEVKQLTKL